jgi:solute carrier family 35, member E3
LVQTLTLFFSNNFFMSILAVVWPLSLNVFASCGTIFVNKHIFQNHHFTFGLKFSLKKKIGTALTVCHFIITFLLCALCAQFGVFSAKKLDMKKVIQLSFAFCGYVVFNNLSLLFNSVSFYQVISNSSLILQR